MCQNSIPKPNGLAHISNCVLLVRGCAGLWQGIRVCVRKQLLSSCNAQYGAQHYGGGNYHHPRRAYDRG